MQKLSRRKLAAYIADQYDKGVPLQRSMRELAAYLVETGRTREAQLIVRAIEDELEARGTVVVTVTSARALSAAMRREIAALIGAKKLELRETVDPDVIGGVRVETPSALLDATIQRKLTLLHGAKV